MCVWTGWMKGRGFIYCGSSLLRVWWSFVARRTQVEAVFIEQKKLHLRKRLTNGPYKSDSILQACTRHLLRARHGQ